MAAARVTAAAGWAAARATATTAAASAKAGVIVTWSTNESRIRLLLLFLIDEDVLVRVDNDVQRADLRQPELLVLDAGCVDFFPRAYQLALHAGASTAA